MGWIIPSFRSLAVGAMDDAIERERRDRRRRLRRGSPSSPVGVDIDEQELIDRIIRLPVHVRVERMADHRPFQPPRNDD